MSTTIVKSHWHHPIASFQTSTQNFYAAVEQAMKLHEIPGTTVSRIDWYEGGAFSAKREYLRVKRDRLVFDVCAAPFGADYFFSWWLAEVSGKYGVWYFLGAMFGIFVLFGMLASAFNGMMGNDFGSFLAIPMAFIALPVALWTLGFFIHNGSLGADVEESVMDTPLFGWLYIKIFGPGTYYKIDTMQAFQAAVQSSVNEAVDAVLSAKGLQALTDDERKPAMNDFFKR